MSEKPKEQLILEAAFVVFSKKGFYSAKVKEIAEIAGIGKGTIYEYFESKAHLFHELFKWHIKRYMSEVEEGIDQETTAIAKIYLVIRNHIAFGQKFKNLAGKLLSETLPHDAALEKDFKQTMLKIHKEILTNLETIIIFGVKNGEFREDIDTQAVAAFIFGSLGGITKSMVMLNQNMDPDETAQKAIDLLLNGMKK